MRAIDNERVRLAYLAAMGLQQWLPKDAQAATAEHTQEKVDTSAVPSLTEDSDQPQTPATQPANRAEVVETQSCWTIHGEPQPWLWLLADGDDVGNPLLVKIQQACKVTSPAYTAQPGGEGSAVEALEGVELIVVFGEEAWDASGLSRLRKELNCRLIQTVSLARLAEDKSSKARLWKQLQSLL